MRLRTCSRTGSGDTLCSPVEMLESRMLLAAPELLDSNPFGVGSSAESSGRYANWLPQMSAIGIKWLRTSFSFNNVEPSQGNWSWNWTDNWVNTATANGMYCSGLLSGNASWINSNTNTFPTANLPAWSTFVSNVVSRYQNSIGYWEIWNEPESFSSGGTPAQYASVVVAAYNAAKAIDPNCKIGLSVASVDIPYLEQAIQAGAKDHFDYIVVHPYELLGSLESGQEAEYMSIVPTIRKMLATDDPALVNAPVWITEMGEELGGKNGTTTVTQTSQAQDLVKAYTMGIAQGMAHMEWFEAHECGTYNMGLLDAPWNASTPRMAYYAYRNLISTLGPSPQYLGWVQLSGSDYGFVFQGASGPVMVAWAPPGATHSVSFDSTVTITDPLTGTATRKSTYSLGNAPVYITGLPPNLVAQARFNKGLAFPWGGDYTGAQLVSANMGSTNTESGLHQLDADASSTAATISNTSVRNCSKSSAQCFTVDPNFLSYTTTPVTITIVAWGISGNPGFNVKYETAGGWGSKGWYNLGSGHWTTITVSITDARFVGKWAYNFRLDSDSTGFSNYYLQSITVTKQASSITAAPASVTLVAGYDSGVVGDGVTNLNNGSSARALAFNVSGTLAGARVYLYSGSTLLGSTLATGSNTIVTTDGLSTLPDGSYTITAKQVASGQILSAATPGMPLVIDTLLPTVSGVVVNDSNVQRSMVSSLSVTLSEAVTLLPGAIILQQHGGGSVANVTLAISNPSGDGRSYLVSFAGSAIVGGSLADGVYDLVIKAGQVQDAVGNGLASDASLTFHRLYGDIDGDGTVTSIDLANLRRSYGLSSGQSGYLAAFDFDGDGVITSMDLAQFRRRYGVSVSY